MSPCVIARIVAGQCTQCRAAAEEGHRRCAACLEHGRRATQATRDARRAAGECIECGANAVPFTHCFAHRQARAYRRKKDRYARLAGTSGTASAST